MKQIIALFLGCLVSISIAAEPIQMATNLSDDASIGRINYKPIVLFVTADHCPYCEQLRRAYFQFSPSDERFILREIELDKYHSLIDFDGSTINHQLLADRYNVTLTPTVVFVGPDGSPLGNSIVGVLTMDFYHHYFEKALNQSIALLQDKEPVTQP